MISILALVAAFVLATMLPINLGAISLVAAFVIGTLALGKGPGDEEDGEGGEESSGKKGGDSGKK